MPANTFVATFLGAPPMNLIGGSLVRHNGHVSFRCEGYELAIDPLTSGIAPDTLSEAVGEAQLGVRPEHLTLAPPEGEGLPGVVRFLEPVGSDLFVSVEVAGHAVQVRMPPDTQVSTGANVRLAFDPARSHIFGADSQNLRS